MCSLYYTISCSKKQCVRNSSFETLKATLREIAEGTARGRPFFAYLAANPFSAVVTLRRVGLEVSPTNAFNLNMNFTTTTGSKLIVLPTRKVTLILFDWWDMVQGTII